MATREENDTSAVPQDKTDDAVDHGDPEFECFTEGVNMPLMLPDGQKVDNVTMPTDETLVEDIKKQFLLAHYSLDVLGQESNPSDFLLALRIPDKTTHISNPTVLQLSDMKTLKDYEPHIIKCSEAVLLPVGTPSLPDADPFAGCLKFK